MSTRSVPVGETAWPVARLGDIADVRLGKMLDKAKHRVGALMPYLRNINVRWGAVQTDDLFEMYFKDDEEERYGLRPGDVLVCEGGEPGRAAVWDGRVPGLRYQKALHRVRFKNAYEPRLLVYLLELLAKTGWLERRFTGSTIKHLTRESLIELPVPVPPLDEQRRIVGEIEEQLTRLDAGIAALKRVQANLKRYRAAVLKAACEGRLVPTEATLARQEARRYEPASALLQRVCADRERVFAPQTQTGHQGRYTKPAEADSRDLPRLPEGWALASLEQLTSATRPICYGILMPKEHIPGGVLYVKVKDMKGDRIEPSSLQRTSPEIAARYRRSALLPGDVLLAIRGTYGRVVPAPPELQGGNITQDTVRLDVSAEVDSNYITWCLRSDDVQRYFKRVARGVAVKGVNVGDIRRTPIALPPLEEQHRIVTEIERHFSLVGALDQVVSTNLRRATRLRQSVLFALFPGRPAARVERVAPDGLAIVPKETAAYPAGPKVE